MSNSFFMSDRQGELWQGLRDREFFIEESRVDGELCIRITSPNGRRWLAGKKMSYPMNSHMVYQLADNKRASYEIAHRLGIVAPRSMYCRERDDVIDRSAILKDYRRVVVKPLDSYQSKGVTLNITTSEELAVALESAWRESPTAIVQEQVDGEEYRFTVLDGRVISVLRRERPQVVGDGSKTIADLVAAENELRRQLNLSVPYPLWSEETLGDEVSSRRVLGDREVCILSQATMVRNGASIYEVMPETDSSYIDIAERFSREIGAGLLAVDMFIVNHRKQGDYWFNECNTAPALKLYAAVRNHDNSSVIERIVTRTAELLL